MIKIKKAKKSTNILISEIIFTLMTLYVVFVLDLKIHSMTILNISVSEGIKIFFLVIWFITFPLSLWNYLKATDQEKYVGHYLKKLEEKESKILWSKKKPKSIISKKDKNDTNDLIIVLETSLNQLIEIAKGRADLIEIPEGVTEAVRFHVEWSKNISKNGNKSDINWINQVIKRLNLLVEKARNYNEK